MYPGGIWHRHAHSIQQCKFLSLPLLQLWHKACCLSSLGMCFLMSKTGSVAEIPSIWRMLRAKPWLPNQGPGRKWHCSLSSVVMKNSLGLCRHSHVLGDLICSDWTSEGSVITMALSSYLLLSETSMVETQLHPYSYVWFGTSGQVELLGQNILPGKSELEKGQNDHWLLQVPCFAWLELQAGCQPWWGFHLRTGGGWGFGGQRCCITSLSALSKISTSQIFVEWWVTENVECGCQEKYPWKN